MQTQQKWLDEYAKNSTVIWHTESMVSIKNIRNFRYGCNGEVISSWYTKTLDICGIKKMNLVVSYWGGEHIAHVF